MNIKKISLSVLLFSICLLLSGCSLSVNISEDSFNLSKKSHAVTIVWLTVQDPATTCEKLFPGINGKDLPIVSCANQTSNACTIVTGLETTYEIIGQELEKCFQGESNI